MVKQEKLDNLAKLILDLDGDFNMFLQYVNNDDELRFVGATQLTLTWCKWRDSLCRKEIGVIYG